MKLIVALFCIVCPPALYCQVGPVEMTMDTMPVGGNEQREEMRRMQIHDELHGHLNALRDSVSATIDTVKSPSILPELKSVAKDLDSILKQFSATEASSALYRKGQSLLTTSRQRYRKILLSPR